MVVTKARGQLIHGNDKPAQMSWEDNLQGLGHRPLRVPIFRSLPVLIWNTHQFLTLHQSTRSFQFAEFVIEISPSINGQGKKRFLPFSIQEDSFTSSQNPLIKRWAIRVHRQSPSLARD